MRIFDFQKKSWKFIKEQLGESRNTIHNPGCGWYQLYSFRAEILPDVGYLRTCINDRERIALVRINIGEYKF